MRRQLAKRVEQPPLLEITAGDVWQAINTGVGTAFFIGVAAGLLNGRDGVDGEKYLHAVITCVVLLPMVWVPLALGARATSQRKDFTANLLRFLATLFVGLYAVAVVVVATTFLYVRMSKVGG